MSAEAMTEGRAPRWFPFAAIAIILFAGVGCADYLRQVTSDPATLPPEMRPVVENWPTWEFALHAVAVWSSLAGGVLLALRRRLAVALLALAFFSQLIRYTLFWIIPPPLPAGVEFRPEFMIVPTIITLLLALILFFGRHAQRRNWLR